VIYGLSPFINHLFKEPTAETLCGKWWQIRSRYTPFPLTFSFYSNFPWTKFLFNPYTRNQRPYSYYHPRFCFFTPSSFIPSQFQKPLLYWNYKYSLLISVTSGLTCIWKFTTKAWVKYTWSLSIKKPLLIILLIATHDFATMVLINSW